MREIKERAVRRRKVYRSTRLGKHNITVQQLYGRLQDLYRYFVEKDYFKEAGLTKDDLSHQFKCKADAILAFELFPILSWPESQITEDNLLDTIEFLHGHAAKPGKWIPKTSSSNWQYEDYEDYDSDAGQLEFRTMANEILASYKSGIYELAEDGMIHTRGTDGLQHILNIEILSFDEENVDSKVRRAISKWTGRHPSDADRKECIRELADVFEWLQKNKDLGDVLDRKDESDLFHIANKFAIRHHSPDQRGNYDKEIWFFWIFHFYLATYHASIRLLRRKSEEDSSFAR
jgi:hypothetical protein